MERPRGYDGAIVRLYGYPGTFTLSPIDPGCLHARNTDRGRFGVSWFATSDRDSRFSFPVLDSSIVEVGGKPVPLLGLPIEPPASDYPHRRTMLRVSASDRRTALFASLLTDTRFSIA